MCSGNLTIELDGKKVKFPDYCLSSGGSVSFDEEFNEEVKQGQWSISKFPKNFPDELKSEAEELINENVEFGCCGGCI